MSDWIFVLTAASAVAAALAAIASLLQVRSAAHGNEIDAYLRLMQDYGSPEMRGAISDLAAFWRDRRESFETAGEAFLAERERDPDAASKLRGQCRLLTSFFGNAARLHDTGFISRRLFRLLISRPGLNVYYDVCEPINLARNPTGHSKKYGAVLRRVVRQYGDGTY